MSHSYFQLAIALKIMDQITSFLKPCILSFLLLLGGLLNISHAELYRWTDSNGRTHYSDTPPFGKANITQLKQNRPQTQYSEPESESDNEANPTKKTGAPTQENDFTTRRQQEDARAKAKEQQVKYCKDLQNNLKAIHDGARFKTMPDGSRMALDGEVRESEIKKIKQKIMDNCQGIRY